MQGSMIKFLKKPVNAATSPLWSSFPFNSKIAVLMDLKNKMVAQQTRVHNAQVKAIVFIFLFFIHYLVTFNMSTTLCNQMSKR